MQYRRYKLSKYIVNMLTKLKNPPDSLTLTIKNNTIIFLVCELFNYSINHDAQAQKNTRFENVDMIGFLESVLFVPLEKLLKKYKKQNLKRI